MIDYFIITVNYLFYVILFIILVFIIQASLSARDITTLIVRGKKFIQFDLDVVIIDESDSSTYGPLQITNGRKCTVMSWDLISLSKTIDVEKHFKKLLGEKNKINILRGQQLVAKLEYLLKAKLSETITLKVNIIGGKKNLLI